MRCMTLMVIVLLECLIRVYLLYVFKHCAAITISYSQYYVTILHKCLKACPHDENNVH